MNLSQPVTLPDGSVLQVPVPQPQQSLKKGEAELITTAEVPTTPSAPRPKRDTALGLFVGLLLGPRSPQAQGRTGRN